MTKGNEYFIVDLGRRNNVGGIVYFSIFIYNAFLPTAWLATVKEGKNEGVEKILMVAP